MRARNEALDCEAYALAALATLNANLDQLAHRLEAQAEIRKEEKKVAAPEPSNPLTRSAPKQRRSFVNRY